MSSRMIHQYECVWLVLCQSRRRSRTIRLHRHEPRNVQHRMIMLFRSYHPTGNKSIVLHKIFVAERPCAAETAPAQENISRGKRNGRGKIRLAEAALAEDPARRKHSVARRGETEQRQPVKAGCPRIFAVCEAKLLRACNRKTEQDIGTINPNKKPE